MSRSSLAASLAFLVLVWGTTFAAIRIGLQGLPPFAGLALRFAVAGALLAGWWRLSGGSLPRQGGTWALIALNTALNFVVPYVLVYWAEQSVPSGLVALLFATFPLWVALFAQLVLPEERLTATGTVGLLAGFAGVAVIFVGDVGALGSAGTARTAAIFLLSPVSCAAAQVTLRRCGRDIDPFALTAPPILATGAVAAVLHLALERGRPLVFDAATVGSVLYLGVFGTALAFLLYFRLLARLAATRLALITFGFPIVALAVGALLFGEPLGPRLLAGAALVLAGVAATVWGGRAPH